MLAGAEAAAPESDVERKVALVVEHGIRAGRVAAAAFVASPKLQRLTLADYQQHIEALRMYRCRMASVNVIAFMMGLQSTILPRLQFVAMHAYVPLFMRMLLLLISRCIFHRSSRGRCKKLLRAHATGREHIRLRCRPGWGGSVNKLFRLHAANVHRLVGAHVGLEEFKAVSGVAAIDVAITKLNARLAARGTLADALSDACC